MSKATEKALGDLHATLATVFKQFLEMKYTDDEGNPIPPPPHVLSQARQFLKDNHIESGVGAQAGPLAGLAGLPVFEDENVVPIRKEG